MPGASSISKRGSSKQRSDKKMGRPTKQPEYQRSKARSRSTQSSGSRVLRSASKKPNVTFRTAKPSSGHRLPTTFQRKTRSLKNAPLAPLEEEADNRSTGKSPPQGSVSFATDTSTTQLQNMSQLTDSFSSQSSTASFSSQQRFPFRQPSVSSTAANSGLTSTLSFANPPLVFQQGNGGSGDGLFMPPARSEESQEATEKGSAVVSVAGSPRDQNSIRSKEGRKMIRSMNASLMNFPTIETRRAPSAKSRAAGIHWENGQPELRSNEQSGGRFLSGNNGFATTRRMPDNHFAVATRRMPEPPMNHEQNQYDMLQATVMESRILSPGQKNEVSLMIQKAFQELNDCVKELKMLQEKQEGEQDARLVAKMEQVLEEQDSKLKILDDSHQEKLRLSEAKQNKRLLDTSTKVQARIEENRKALEGKLEGVTMAVAGLSTTVESNYTTFEAKLDASNVELKGHIDLQVKSQMDDSKKDMRFLWERLQRNEQTVSQVVEIVEEVAGWGADYVKSLVPSQIHSIKTYFRSSAGAPSFLSFLQGTGSDPPSSNQQIDKSVVNDENGHDEKSKQREAETATKAAKETNKSSPREEKPKRRVLPRRDCRLNNLKNNSHDSSSHSSSNNSKNSKSNIKPKGQPRKRSRVSSTKSAPQKKRIISVSSNDETPISRSSASPKTRFDELEFYPTEMSPNTPPITKRHTRSRPKNQSVVTPFDSKKKPAIVEKENLVPVTRSTKKTTRSRKGRSSIRREQSLFHDDIGYRFATNA